MEKLRGHGKGKVNVPGGKVENETPIEGGIREVKEEVDLTVWNLELKGILRFHDFKTDYRVLGYVYLTEDFSGKEVATDEANPFWIRRNEIPYSLMWEDDRLWLPVVLANQFVEADLLFENDVLVAHKIMINEFGLRPNSMESHTF